MDTSRQLPLTVQKIIIGHSWFNRSVDYSVYYRNDRLELALVNWDWFHHCSALYNWLDGGNVTPKQCGFGYEAPHSLYSNTFGVFKDTKNKIILNDNRTFNPYLDNAMELYKHIQSKYCLLKSIHCLNIETPMETNAYLKRKKRIKIHLSQKSNTNNQISNNNNNNNNQKEKKSIFSKLFGKSKDTSPPSSPQINNQNSNSNNDNNNNVKEEEVIENPLTVLSDLLKQTSDEEIVNNIDTTIYEPGTPYHIILTLMQSITSVNIIANLSTPLLYNEKDKEIILLLMDKLTLLKLRYQSQTHNGWRKVHTIYCNNSMIVRHLGPLFSTLESFNGPFQLASPHYTWYTKPILNNIESHSIEYEQHQQPDFGKLRHLCLFDQDWNSSLLNIAPEVYKVAPLFPEGSKVEIESLDIDGYYNKYVTMPLDKLSEVAPSIKSVLINGGRITDADKKKILDFIQDSTTLQDLSMSQLAFDLGNYQKLIMLLSTKNNIKRWNLNFNDYIFVNFPDLTLNIELHDQIEYLQLNWCCYHHKYHYLTKQLPTWYHLTDLILTVEVINSQLLQLLSQLINHPKSKLKRLYISSFYRDTGKIDEEREGEGITAKAWLELVKSFQKSNTMMLSKITIQQTYPYQNPNPYLPSTQFTPLNDITDVNENRYSIEFKSRDTMYIIRK